MTMREEFKSIKMVEVHWWDAQTYDGKYSPSEVDKLTPSIGRMVGYLLRESDDYYLVASMIFIDNIEMSHECDDVTFIPKSGVVSIKELEVIK